MRVDVCLSLFVRACMYAVVDAGRCVCMCIYVPKLPIPVDICKEAKPVEQTITIYTRLIFLNQACASHRPACALFLIMSVCVCVYMCVCLPTRL